MDSIERLIEELKQRYLSEVVRASSFDFIKYFGRSSWATQGNAKPEASFHLSDYYVDLKGSDYYYSNANKFIHYTSLRNALNIFNDGYLRLNSLSYMDDPQELLFAGNEILDDSSVAKLKENIHCISFCEYEDNNHPDSFDCWRLYGDNGLGVGIVFKFSSEVDYWYDNYIGRMHYGYEGAEKFKTFKANHDKFILENEDKIKLRSSEFGEIGKLPDWIALFLAFHKSSLYKIENEVRFLRTQDASANSYTLNQRFQKTTYGKLLFRSKTNFDKLQRRPNPIGLKEAPDIYNAKWVNGITTSNPIVEIEKIIVGYRHRENSIKLVRAIKNCFVEKNGIQVVVELSPIADSFK